MQHDNMKMYLNNREIKCRLIENNILKYQKNRFRKRIDM